MGLFMKLFGQKLRIRYEGIMEDGTRVSGKSSIEVIGMTKEGIEDWIKSAIYVETGERAKKVEIVGAIEE